MSHWLIPANTKYYEVLLAFQQNETFWPMNAKISCEDTVYIYLAAPYKQIGFICNVLATGYRMDEIIEEILPYAKGDLGKDGSPKPFMKLKTVQSISVNENCALSLTNLRQHGLNGMLMGARKLENNPELFSYISENLS